jgi:hypothetical protein
VPGHSYDRYGLVSNPFRDLASENLEDVGLYHVNQEVDDNLRTIRDEVWEKENKALVAITGELGAGKTERLLVTQAEAKARGAFSIYLDVTPKTAGVVRTVANQILAEARKAKKMGLFSAPPWARRITQLSKLKDQNYDGKIAGQAIAAALNGVAPSALLLNDVHNIVQSKEADNFSRMLLELTDQIKPGVLVMFSFYTSYLAWLSVNHPALASRINRTFVLTTMSDDEAALMLAKKLLVKRLVEDLDPIYPFDREAVHELVIAAQGNPRRLIELADLSIEYGIAKRSYRVDAEVVKAVLAQPRVSQIAAKVLGRPPPTSPAPPATPAARPAAPPPSKSAGAGAAPAAPPAPAVANPGQKPLTRPPG